MSSDNRVDIPLEQVLSARGDKIVGGKTYEAYRRYLIGFKDTARADLEQLHFETYYGPTRNITTDTIVKGIYDSRGIKKPTDYKDSKAEIVLEAVKKRVNDYLVQLENFRDNGYLETTVIKMAKQSDNYIMRSCGENKIAALVALGYKYISGVVLT
jgi:hypothetical protein